MSERKLIGYADVDAGLIWIGDPCYVMGDDASSRVKDWHDFCNKLMPDFRDPNEFNTAPLGEGVGIAVPNFGGDGSYPVYVTYGSDGLVTKAEIFFYYSVDADREIFADNDDDYDDGENTDD